jgi:hypothetical protein
MNALTAQSTKVVELKADNEFKRIATGSSLRSVSTALLDIHSQLRAVAWEDNGVYYCKCLYF